jgi:phage terminase large subunit
MNVLNPVDSILPHFLPVFNARQRYVLAYGGAGSGKSWSVAQMMILRCCLDPGIRVLGIRKVARTIKQSMWTRVVSQLGEWQQLSKCKVNLSDQTIKFPNGSEMLFVGLDPDPESHEPEKLKSIDRIGSIWIEEATELSEKDFIQVNLRLRGETVFRQQIVLTFNPISRLHWIKKRFIDCGLRENVFVHQSTFRDNPHCGEDYAETLLHLREQNPESGRVYTDGEWGILKGLIFKPLDTTPWPAPLVVEEKIYGLDFGFTHPTALVEINLSYPRAYLHQLIYESSMTNKDRLQRFEDLGISKTAPIYADPEDPCSIEEMDEAGYNVVMADKGPGSVRASIELVKSLELHAPPGDEDLLNEFQNYKWDVDRNGESKEVPVKDKDHLIDAVRYGLHTHLRPRLDDEEFEVYDAEDEFGFMVPDLGEEIHV